MRFKDYINENTSNVILNKIASGDIPISTEAMEKIFTVNKEYFFHLTTLTNRKN